MRPWRTRAFEPDRVGVSSNGHGPWSTPGDCPARVTVWERVRDLWSAESCRRGPGYHLHPVAASVAVSCCVLACVAGPVAGAGAVGALLLGSVTAGVAALRHGDPLKT